MNIYADKTLFLKAISLELKIVLLKFMLNTSQLNDKIQMIDRVIISLDCCLQQKSVTSTALMRP